MARLYGQMREAFGWGNSKISMLSLAEAQEIVEHWNEEPPVGRVIRSYFGIDRRAPVAPVDTTPIEMTDEQWRRMCAADEAEAAQNGRASPFA